MQHQPRAVQGHAASQTARESLVTLTSGRCEWENAIRRCRVRVSSRWKRPNVTSSHHPLDASGRWRVCIVTPSRGQYFGLHIASTKSTQSLCPISLSIQSVLSLTATANFERGPWHSRLFPWRVELRHVFTIRMQQYSTAASLTNLCDQLSNGLSMPLIHLGVYLTSGSETSRAVRWALEVQTPSVHSH